MNIFKTHIRDKSDEDLMKLLSSKKMKQQALTELHRRYGGKLLGFFLRMFRGDEHKAQDFVQNLFLRILEKSHQFDPQKRFYSWMFAIASNMCKTEFREMNKFNHLETGSEREQENWSEDFYDKKEFQKALKSAMTTLSEDHRIAFELRYLQQLSISEISAITQVSEGTIKSRLFYSTKKMAEKLKEFDPTGENKMFKMN